MKKLAITLLVVFCAVVNIASADLVTQLTGYWKMDGNLTDSSTQGIDLTTSYGAVFDSGDTVGNSTHSLATIEDSIGAGAARSEAVNDAIDSTYALSMSCWFKWDQAPTGSASLMSKWGGTTAHNKYFKLYFWNGDRLYFNLGNDYNNSQEIGVTDLSINLGSWYHVAVSVDTYAANQNEVVKIYLTEEGSSSVNLIKTSAWAPPDNSGGTSQVMNYYNDGWFEILPNTQNFNGNADEFRFYKQRALAESDVQAIYDLEVPEPATVVLLSLGATGFALKRKK